MWLEEVDELFKGYLPYYFLLVLPIFIIVSPANPVSASSEFPVYRMQQFDLQGVSRGCRSAGINLEARSLTSWSTSRHCVITKLKDLTVDSYQNIKQKAGGLLVMLPDDFPTLNTEDKELLMILENAMLAQEVSIPVYFTHYTKKLDTIIDDVAHNVGGNDMSKSAAETMLNTIAANGYQISISSSTPTVKTDARIANIHGHLAGYSTTGSIPVIGVVAHYDSFGIAPELSYGADSNGSGVVILLELVRIFSGLYADVKTRGRYNMIFLLSGGGKLNYQGTKKWLEDQLDNQESSFIQQPSYIMCLDTLAANDSLYMHVSKPPREGSPAYQFYHELKTVSQDYNVVVDSVHKKINLAHDLLGWEHERYSIRKMPAFTVSALNHYRDLQKITVLDTRENLDIDRLVTNTKIIAEALARHIYNVSDGNVFGQTLDVSRRHIEAWIDYLTLQPRSPQLLSNKENVLVNTLKETFNKYLRDIKVSYAIPDKRDPDFQFYDSTKGIVNIYSVKPAVFDLVLTLVIILYLGLFYFSVDYFPKVYKIACSLTSNNKKIKTN